VIAGALTRRQFMQVSLTAAGALLADLRLPAFAASVPAGMRTGVDLGVFVRVEPDGRVVIGARGCEIGQGVKTSLPMLIAEDMDVPWSQVAVEQLPYGLLPDATAEGGLKPKYGPQGAGGSTSISDGWSELRQAGAQLRYMFVQAAAATWGADAAALTTREGRVLHPDGRTLGYGELAERAARIAPPAEALPLKARTQYTVIGTPVRVADARDIVTGHARYGIDATLPGALVAVIARCPWIDGEVGRVDDAAARAIPGVRDVVLVPGPKAGEPFARNLAAGVAVVADDTWAALRGRDALVVDWRKGPWADASSADLERRAHAAFDASGTIVRSDGDYEVARASAAHVVEQRYVVPFLAHATMEPQHATVEVRNGRARLVGSLQSPGGASRMISAMTGIPRLDIDIELTRAGGGFGRRLANDFVAEVVLVAQAVQAPVKVVWTREDDMRHDWYRPFGVHALSASLDASGRVTGWAHRTAATSRKYREADMAEADDWIGCADPDNFPAGGVANYLNEWRSVEFGLARGWWRAPLHTFSAFAVQSFTDEVAHAAGQDPVAFRLALLGEPRELDYRDHGGPKFHTGRLADVLKAAARRIGWGRAVAPGRGLGIACHFTFGGYTAHAMEVEVGAGGTLRIARCVCVTDVGEVVNPLGVEAQMMGGTIDGLSTALGLEITVEGGRVVQGNFMDYPLMRMQDAPDVEVEILRTDHAPCGAGEMGIPSAAPALANAIYAATGKRLRKLPLRAQLTT
jgi:isoquinoline 1-oxidoreductase subunit beta